MIRLVAARWRAICTVLLTIGVLAELAAGQIEMLISPGWLTRPPAGWPFGVSTPYMQFVDAHLPSGQIVVLYSATADAGEFFRLSYTLAGRNEVFWLTGAAAHRPPDWWRQTDGSASDLLQQARSWHATYVAFDGLDPPAGLKLSELTRFAAHRSLGRLGST